MIDREKKRLDELLKGLDDTDSGLSSSEVCKLGLSMTLSFLIFITPSAFQPKLTLFPLEDILCIKTLIFSKLFPQRNMLFVLPKHLAFWSFISSDWIRIWQDQSISALPVSPLAVSVCVRWLAAKWETRAYRRTGQSWLEVLEQSIYSDRCGHREAVPDNARPQLCDYPGCQDPANVLREARISDF